MIICKGEQRKDFMLRKRCLSVFVLCVCSCIQFACYTNLIFSKFIIRLYVFSLRFHLYTLDFFFFSLLSLVFFPLPFCLLLSNFISIIRILVVKKSKTTGFWITLPRSVLWFCHFLAVWPNFNFPYFSTSVFLKWSQ